MMRCSGPANPPRPLPVRSASMSARPPVSVRRPGRPAEDPTHEAPRSIAPATVPNLDLDSRDALAFTLRGRPTADLAPPAVVQALQPPASPPSPFAKPPSGPVHGEHAGAV